MTTRDESETGGARDDPIAVAGERIGEAKQAADEVARREHLTDEERHTAADAVGRATGEGAEIAPG